MTDARFAIRPPTTTRWGTELETALIGGRPCRRYRDRPRHVADFVTDALRWRDRPYLVQGERRITFSDFAVAMNAAADHLVARGAGPGTRTALLAANSTDWVVTFFAILQAGGQVVLGNAWWSPDEIAHALAVTEPTLVVADQRRAERLPPGTATLDVAAVGRCAHREPVSVPEDRPPTLAHDEDEPAVVLFTSGTTGAPKGAVLSHRSVIGNIQNLLVTTRRLPPMLTTDHPGTVNLVCVPLFHVGGMQTVMTTLLTGGTLVFLTGRFDPAKVLQLIEDERVRVWGAVPTMLSRVLDHPDLGHRDTSSLSSLTIGGSLVPPELLERARAAFPTAQGRTGTVYGMTETGGALTAVVGRDMEERPGTVGRALPTVDLRIADPDADGFGEIFARSPTLMDGYLGCPDDPILTADGWLRTGDLGRIDDDGYVFVLGRNKDIVIRGGENIACAHVEAAILTHPGVQHVAVLGLPDPDYGEQVAAAIVRRPGATVAENDLARHLEGRLAYFQIPSQWWIRDEPLPTNATGKVLKQDLRRSWPAAGDEQ